jgi:hypothetical protein
MPAEAWPHVPRAGLRFLQAHQVASLRWRARSNWIHRLAQAAAPSHLAAALVPWLPRAVRRSAQRGPLEAARIIARRCRGRGT